MSSERASPDLSTADYESIEAAVMETARGRWFLGEYARRLRAAETQAILAALDRIESKIDAGAQEQPAEMAVVAAPPSSIAAPPVRASANSAAMSAIEALAQLSGQAQASLTA